MNIKAINDLFDKAHRHLKKPNIVLLLGDGKQIRLKPAPLNGRNPGAVYVTNKLTRDYYGKIDADGTFASNGFVPQLNDVLSEFAANPEAVAAKHGKLMGICCFCSIRLSDERSTEVGYGPICAGHYGLPWGSKRAQMNDEYEGSIEQQKYDAQLARHEEMMATRQLQSGSDWCRWL